jgi:hypothetical protein
MLEKMSALSAGRFFIVLYKDVAPFSLLRILICDLSGACRHVIDQWVVVSCKKERLYL